MKYCSLRPEKRLINAIFRKDIQATIWKILIIENEDNWGNFEKSIQRPENLIETHSLVALTILIIYLVTNHIQSRHKTIIQSVKYIFPDNFIIINNIIPSIYSSKCCDFNLWEKTSKTWMKISLDAKTLNIPREIR